MSSDKKFPKYVYLGIPFRRVERFLWFAFNKNGDEAIDSLESAKELTEIALQNERRERRHGGNWAKRLEALTNRISEAINDAENIPVAYRALTSLAIDAATSSESTRTVVKARNRSTGRAGGKTKKRNAADRQSEWIDAAREMLKINPHKKPADLARAIAADPDETASAGWIAKVLRKGL